MLLQCLIEIRWIYGGLSMEEHLVSGSELISARRERSKSFIYKNVSQKMVEAMEEEGWEFDKQLKRSIRMRKQKPADEQFENEVWLVFQRLGFFQMNRDRKFKIQYGTNGTNGTSKQIDVFAADDETAIVIECKCAKQPHTPSNFKNTIESMAGTREGIIRQINTSQGSKVKKKVKFILATKNYDLSETDKSRLQDSQIAHFDEPVLSYFNELSKHLGPASRFQLLGYLLSGNKINGINSKYPAIRGKMGGKEYYAFSMEPEQLLKMSYVLHRSDYNKTELPSYQRIVKKSRLNQVRNFIDNGGFFPNSIVVNIDTGKNKLQFDLSKISHDSKISDAGVLHLPSLYRSMYIIDGQHRLYGYSGSEYSTKNSIPVVAFVNLSKAEQVKLFMEINENQKNVSKNLRNTLNADALWHSDKKIDQVKAVSLQLAQRLGEDTNSPLFGKFVFGEDKEGETAYLKMESVAEAIQKSDLLNKYDRRDQLKSNGLIDKGDNPKTLELLFNYITGILGYVKTNAEKEWNKGNNGVLISNPGVYALIRVSGEILKHLKEHDGMNLLNSKADKMVEESKRFLLALCDSVNEMDLTEWSNLKNSYGSGAKPKYQKKFQVIIYNKFREFQPEGIERDSIELNRTYNQYASDILPLLKNRVKIEFENAMNFLYSDNWEKSLPNQVWRDSNLRLSDINQKKELGDELRVRDILTLSEYEVTSKDSSNWKSAFSTYFTRPEEKKGNMTKEKRTEWLRDLAKLDKKNLDNYDVTVDDFTLLKSLEKWLL